MQVFNFNTDTIKESISKLNCGDKVYLSGTIYTARDAAHKKICDAIENGEQLPFKLRDSIIYYAGPTPTPENLPIGSCGPTTSVRMDKFTPQLLDNGLLCTIGKGKRSDEVIASIVKNNSVYFSATGGAGALLASSVKKCEIIAYPELGCEAVRKLTVENLPLTVAVDSKGNSIFSI